MSSVVVVDLAHPPRVVPIQLLELAVFLGLWFCRGRTVPLYEFTKVPEVRLAELVAGCIVFLNVMRDLGMARSLVRVFLRANQTGRLS